MEGETELWTKFADDLSIPVFANHFGIEEWELSSDRHAFILVRIKKSYDNQTLAENVKLNDTNAKQLDNFDTIVNLPTHYIKSYATGNSLYQVLVFEKQFYERIKNAMKDRGLAVYSDALRRIFFSPPYVIRAGEIRTASRNRAVEDWATKSVRTSYYDRNWFSAWRSEPYEVFFSSLILFYRNATLFNQLDELLRDEVLLQLEIPLVTRLMSESSQMSFVDGNFGYFGDD
ncbi:torso-like protein [Venturia canescens]|uniref:torso-like protein n=1 Tax=Venturia canescens TaxID=32260 RepID=UPI001C9C97D0|nr:torso-like protein [Venturia canescens]